jgi:hypothetical protein
MISMKKQVLFSLVLSMVSLLPAWSQQAKEHSKKNYVDSLNRYYIQKDLPVYFQVSNNANGSNPVSLQAEEKQRMELKPLYLDGSGKHVIKHTDEKTKKEYDLPIYADGIAPITTVKFLQAPHFVNATTNFYGKELIINIATKDEMSGINALYQSLDGIDYSIYQAQLNSLLQGKHKLKFYAVDNVGNAETPHERLFTVDLSAPETFHNVVGISSDNVISLSSRIYLTAQDSISGVAKTEYAFDAAPRIPYLIDNVLPLASLTDGNHVLNYYSKDNVNNIETVKELKFYLDRTAPIMASDVLGDRFVVGTKVYFSGRTKLKLTAIDNKSGIKEVLYSIDGEPFQPYSEPIYLPSKPGNHTVKYYALDNASNQGIAAAHNATLASQEYKYNVSTVYVDLTGPSIASAFEGRTFAKGDTVFINSATKIRLSGSDNESGLQKILYSYGSDVQEEIFAAPFTVSGSGYRKLSIFGYDNVNNRNVKTTEFVVDNQGPEVFHHFSVSAVKGAEGQIYFPSYTSLTVASTDSQTGGEKITYAINGGAELTYTLPLTGFVKNKKYEVKVSAFDKLGNKTVSEVNFLTGTY